MNAKDKAFREWARQFAAQKRAAQRRWNFEVACPDVNPDTLTERQFTTRCAAIHGWLGNNCTGVFEQGARRRVNGRGWPSGAPHVVFRFELWRDALALAMTANGSAPYRI